MRIINLAIILVISSTISSVSAFAEHIVLRCTVQGNPPQELIVRFQRHRNWIKRWENNIDDNSPSFISAATLTLTGSRSVLGLLRGRHMGNDDGFPGNIALFFSGQGRLPQPSLSLMEFPEQQTAFGVGQMGRQTMVITNCHRENQSDCPKETSCSESNDDNSSTPRTA